MTKHTNRSASLSFFFFADRFVFFCRRDRLWSHSSRVKRKSAAERRRREQRTTHSTGHGTSFFLFLQVGERGSWRGVVTPPLVCSQTRLVPTHPRPTVWRSPCFLFVFRSAVARPFFLPLFSSTTTFSHSFFVFFRSCRFIAVRFCSLLDRSCCFFFCLCEG